MRYLLWVCVALVACDSGAPASSCKDVVTKARGAFDMPLERAERLVGNCELSRWSATVKSCVATAKTQDEVDTCAEDADGANTHMAEAMKKMTEFKNQICACKDAPCAQRVSDAMTNWSQDEAKQQAQEPKLSDEDSKRFAKLGEEMGTCMQKAMGQPASPSR